MNISHTVPSDLPGNQTFSTFSDKEDGPTPPISPVPLSFDSVYWIKNRMSRESGYVKMTANTKRKAHQQVKSNVAGSLPRSHSSSSGHTNASSPQSGGCGEKPRDGLVWCGDDEGEVPALPLTFNCRADLERKLYRVDPCLVTSSSSKPEPAQKRMVKSEPSYLAKKIKLELVENTKSNETKK